MSHMPSSITALAIAAFVALTAVSDARAEPPRLDFGKAEAIALEQFPGAIVEQIERDWEHGREAFEVELRTKDGVEYELRIDAISGEILRKDRER